MATVTLPAGTPAKGKHSARFEANSATRDAPLIKGVILLVSLGFFAVFLFLPLCAVFAEALRKGWNVYISAVTEPDALSAVRLTLLVAAIAVPLNLIFGIAAAWAIAKFAFPGKQLLMTLIDLPFSVSPVIAGLIYVLLFGAQGWLGPWLAAYDIKIIFALPGIVLATIFVTFPFDPPQATSDEAGKPLLDEDYLILSTIHSAKGQEWKAVSILNVVDGCIPSDLATGTSDEIEEERRLLYVAMTRAKDDLNLIVPQRFYTHQQARSGDRHVYAGRSRFIPANITGHFNRVTWPSAGEKKVEAPMTSAPVDLRERLRGMWSKVS
jgi:hypothetical protein